MGRIRAAQILARKGQPFAVVTAYDAPFASFAETAEIDVLLVGDSLGMVVLGYDSTSAVELLDMERHGAAVARGTKTAHVIVDLPFGSYEESEEHAVRSALRLVKYGGASSVKLEGGLARASRIAAIVASGIPVVAHIGVLPQTAALTVGYRSVIDEERLLEDAHAVEKAGAFAVVLEKVQPEIAKKITAELKIPTIGIGSGADCDAQVLVLHDILGLYPKTPPFARRYTDLSASATEALQAYARDVKTREFPRQHSEEPKISSATKIAFSLKSSQA